jgi:hypothetical protein
MTTIRSTTISWSHGEAPTDFVFLIALALLLATMQGRDMFERRRYGANLGVILEDERPIGDSGRLSISEPANETDQADKGQTRA